jgi:hypothetical protein
MPARPAAPARHAAQAPAWSDIPREHPKTPAHAARGASGPAPRILHVTQPAPAAAAAFRKPAAPVSAVPAPVSVAAAPAAARPGAGEPDTAEAASARPAWKQAGLWIGGGAALAAVAFTFIRAGGSGSGSRTYAVPATVSK